MTTYYRRTETGPGENLKAGLVAGAAATTVAAVSFYLVRIFLSREPLEPLEPGDSGGNVVPPEASKGTEG